MLMCPSAPGMPWDAGAANAGRQQRRHVHPDDAAPAWTTRTLCAAATTLRWCRTTAQPQTANGYWNGWQNQFERVRFPVLVQLSRSPDQHERRVAGLHGPGQGRRPLHDAGPHDGRRRHPDGCIPARPMPTSPTAPLRASRPTPAARSSRRQKLLGDRAICSDTFSKWDEATEGAYSPTLTTQYRLGYGTFAHKTAYNVLYGDWHVAQVADNEGVILNWSEANCRRHSAGLRGHQRQHRNDLLSHVTGKALRRATTPCCPLRPWPARRRSTCSAPAKASSSGIISTPRSRSTF